jgi:glutamate/tyrosine decarboxylase-like PLP-dependent enzyme
VTGPVVICAQAGEANTGAFDPFPAIVEWARRRQAWVHVDGAFGLWALTDPSRSHLTAGLADADSWATDGHKWLNVPYDCGIALVRRPGDLRRSFATAAAYLPPDTGFEATNHTPQSSQRARQVEVWAILRTLDRQGVTDLITRTCRHAQTMSAYLGSDTNAAVDHLQFIHVERLSCRTAEHGARGDVELRAMALAHDRHPSEPSSGKRARDVGARAEIVERVKAVIDPHDGDP